MHDFSLHHQGAVAATNFVPKAGDLVSAKFSDGSWYRARVRRASEIIVKVKIAVAYQCDREQTSWKGF